MGDIFLILRKVNCNNHKISPQNKLTWLSGDNLFQLLCLSLLAVILKRIANGLEDNKTSKGQFYDKEIQKYQKYQTRKVVKKNIHKERCSSNYLNKQQLI